MIPCTVNPAQFNLPFRIVLMDTGNGNITLVKIRKGRIIMKDGKKILEIRNKILGTGGYTSFTLKTNAPVCSKTREFLKQSGIAIEKVSE